MNLYKHVSKRTSTRDTVELYVQRKAVMKKWFKAYKHNVFLTTMCKDFNFHFSMVFASCVWIDPYVFVLSVFGLITSAVTWLSLPITFMLVGD